jgi:hypothetical protein
VGSASLRSRLVLARRFASLRFASLRSLLLLVLRVASLAAPVPRRFVALLCARCVASLRPAGRGLPGACGVKVVDFGIAKASTQLAQTRAALGVESPVMF